MNIQAINAELARIGYKAVKLPKKRPSHLPADYPPHHPDCVCGCNVKPVDRLTVWNPQTAAGRRCKAAMKFWASWPKAIGVKSYYCGACYVDRNVYAGNNGLGGPWPDAIAAFYADKL